MGRGRFAVIFVILHVFVSVVLSQENNVERQFADITNVTTDNFDNELAKKSQVAGFSPKGNAEQYSAKMTDLTTENFDKELAKNPHLVMFYVPG